MTATLGRECPRCRSRLAADPEWRGRVGTVVERVNRATDVPFLGCSRWPDCEWTMPLPAAEVMRRAGNAELPGMGDA